MSPQGGLHSRVMHPNARLPGKLSERIHKTCRCSDAISSCRASPVLLYAMVVLTLCRVFSLLLSCKTTGYVLLQCKTNIQHHAAKHTETIREASAFCSRLSAPAGTEPESNDKEKHQNKPRPLLAMTRMAFEMLRVQPSLQTWDLHCFWQHPCISPGCRS